MLTLESIAADQSFLEAITGVERQQPEPLTHSNIRVSIATADILKNVVHIVLETGGRKIKSAQWVKRQKLQTVRDWFRNIGKLPSHFVPVSCTTRDKLSVLRNEAVINVRCTNWLSACTTTCSISFKLIECASRRKINVQFSFDRFKCHQHPIGVVNGQILDEKEQELYRDKQPRLAQIENYNVDYDPFDATRRVPTHAATKRIRSLAIRSNCHHKDWFKSLKKQQQIEQTMDEFKHLNAPYRGNIHSLTPEPKAGVAYYNEQCMFSFLYTTSWFE